jgi:hypothetical protein
MACLARAAASTAQPRRTGAERWHQRGALRRCALQFNTFTIVADSGRFRRAAKCRPLPFRARASAGAGRRAARHGGQQRVAAGQVQAGVSRGPGACAATFNKRACRGGGGTAAGGSAGKQPRRVQAWNRGGSRRRGVPPLAGAAALAAALPGAWQRGAWRRGGKGWRMSGTQKRALVARAETRPRAVRARAATACPRRRLDAGSDAVQRCARTHMHAAAGPSNAALMRSRSHSRECRRPSRVRTQSVGKTSIITRFMYDKFDNTYQARAARGQPAGGGARLACSNLSPQNGAACERSRGRFGAAASPGHARRRSASTS